MAFRIFSSLSAIIQLFLSSFCFFIFFLLLFIVKQSFFFSILIKIMKKMCLLTQQLSSSISRYNKNENFFLFSFLSLLLLLKVDRYDSQRWCLTSREREWERDEGKVLQADNKFFLLSFYFILAWCFPSGWK